MFAFVISQNVFSQKSDKRNMCFKFIKLFMAILWVLITSLNCIILGSNTLNQITFGLTTGFLIASIITFVLNKQKRISRHFQKLVRGRQGEEFNQEDIQPGLRVIFYTLSGSIILYTSIYFIVRYYLKSSSEKQNLLQEEYFQNILDMCGDFQIPFDKSEYMQYFLRVSVYQIGYMMTYTGVYLGALYRKHQHGLERIDYSEYYDYDPDQKPISSCCHNVTMLIGRTVVLSFYLVPIIYTKIYIWNNY
jgi:hypothetical protein